MKKHYLTLGALLGFIGVGMAQINDDFEAYPVGSYLGATSTLGWTTWSGNTGGTEDVKIVDNNAASGTKSIYFSTTSANGGPNDVVLPFGGAHTTGQFQFESKFFVESNKGAYFNFQASATIGSVWALDCYMVNNGNLIMTNSGSTLISSTYPSNTWFTLKFDVNLNSNEWSVYLDNQLIGTFANPVNSIASIDIYPVNPSGVGGNNTAGYWVDDVSYSHTPYNIPNKNGAVTLVNKVTGLMNQERSVSGKFRNLGTTAITAFDVEYTYNGTNYTQSFSGLNIASLATYDFEFSQPISLVSGANPLTVTVTSVNGSAGDDDAGDDAKTITVNPIIQAPGKKVFVEEGTGTWCQWCPRGAVYMDYMAHNYEGYFVGIAVHNGDPMTDPTYDTGIGALISGYPSALVNRGADIDPSAIEEPFLSEIQVPQSVDMALATTYNAATSEITLTVTSTIATAISGNWKLLAVLSEDHVTGTGSGYNQSNAYAGGNNGVMGGYEALPNPVPAAQMIYDHVGRTILPSFEGMPNAFGSSAAAGATFTHDFVFTLDPTWDIDNLILNTVVLRPDGSVDNANSEFFMVMNGIESPETTNTVKLYPNPSNGLSNIALNLDASSDVQVTIADINGRIVAQKNYGTLSGNMLLPVVTTNFASGIYVVSVNINNELKTLRLVVE